MDFLREHPNLSVVVFCNSRKQLKHFTSHLEQKLDTVQLPIDVINISSLLDKIDKFWQIRQLPEAIEALYKPSGYKLDTVQLPNDVININGF